MRGLLICLLALTVCTQCVLCGSPLPEQREQRQQQEHHRLKQQQHQWQQRSPQQGEADSRHLARGGKALFKGVQATQSCKSDQENGAPALSGFIGGPSSIDSKCQKEVLPKYADSDKMVKVLDVKRAQLDCEALDLHADMSQLSFDFQSQHYLAVRNSYESFPKFMGRHVWTGELVGAVGSVTVVWNDDCDAQIFHLLVSLSDDMDGKRNAIRSVPCVDGDCTWLAELKSEPREEYEGHHEQHRALAEAVEREHRENPDAAALDADIELLRLLMEGDGDAHDHFHRHGGRRLEEEGAVIMPSGRRLDDGKIVRVLFVYTPESRARWGESTLRSMIIGGVASANQVLSNSGLGFKIEAAAIMPTTWAESGGHVGALNALNSGTVPGVNAARDQYKADLVQMVINDAQYCGFGNIMTSTTSSFSKWAFSVMYSGCFSTYSHIHEMGHNMGAQHDTSNSQHITAWAYGQGWRYCSGETDSPYFRSVMSYNCKGATRVPYFSSPNLYYQGRTTGNSNADNVRVIKANMYTVANFRQTV